MNASIARVATALVYELPQQAVAALLEKCPCFGASLSVVAICFAGFFHTLLVMPGGSLFGQEGAEYKLADEQQPREADRDAFEEESPDPKDHLRELAQMRRELVGQLREQRQPESSLQSCIRSIDALISQARQSQAIQRAMNLAKGRGDRRSFRRLASKLRENNRIFSARNWLFNFQILEIEFAESLVEAFRGEDDAARRLATTLRQGLREGKTLSRQLLKSRLGDDEQDEYVIEEDLDAILDDLVHPSIAGLELLAEIREAEEDEERDLAEQLRAEFGELQEEFDLFGEFETDKPISKSKDVLALQPVLVTQETLAPYAAMDLNRDVVPLLEQYCFDCHSSETSSGELDFEQLLRVSPIVKNRRKWISVIEQTKNHVMPPEDAAQPTIEERKKIVLSLHNAIYNFDYSQIRDPGYEGARRLTHREYSNTVRDLFGIEVDVAERFPADLTATSGFDNSANSLFIQPLLMERYVGLAEYVVAFALPESPSNASEKKVVDRIFVTRPSETQSLSAAAKKVIARFLFRAFRRSPTSTELDRYTEQIVRAVQQGDTFENAVKATLRTILVSPSFLLLTERSKEGTSEPFSVSDYDLASRLSYFLWASMPDDVLLRLAYRGQLAKPKVLAQQVERMLADPKADTLGTVFASQWLGSQHLGIRVRLDPIDNPWCTESLMSAMRQETAMFFNALVRGNRPVTELIDADYTYINQELAKLYRISGVSGTHMRRVRVDPKKRGGILGHGSLLAVTSFPGRTSPVVRGKWILDNVLGTPPPPPPPNVSELSDDIESKQRLSFREKLELHRDQPNCYACHSQMDPLGFSLENFDWFGRYRSKRGRSPIDAKGRLPNGTEFEGLFGLKHVIVEQKKDDLIRQVTQKMLSYALGRQLEYYDEPAVREIIKNLGQQDNRLGFLVREIVLSYPFRYKRSTN